MLGEGVSRALGKLGPTGSNNAVTSPHRLPQTTGSAVTSAKSTTARAIDHLDAVANNNAQRAAALLASRQSSTFLKDLINRGAAVGTGVGLAACAVMYAVGADMSLATPVLAACTGTGAFGVAADRDIHAAHDRRREACDLLLPVLEAKREMLPPSDRHSGWPWWPKRVGSISIRQSRHGDFGIHVTAVGDAPIKPGDAEALKAAFAKLLPEDLKRLLNEVSFDFDREASSPAKH